MGFCFTKFKEHCILKAEVLRLCMGYEKENYLKWVDVAKGIGIILVVIGHCFRDDMRTRYYICDFIYQFIYSFHMPLFFCISGITFYITYKKYIKNKIVYLKKKVQALLIPFITYSFLVYVLFSIASILPGIGQILKDSSFFKVGFGEYVLANIKAENPFAIHLWFIWIIFLVEVFMFLLLSYFKWDNIKCQILFIFISIALSLIFMNIPIMAVQYFLKNIPYFSAGVIIAQLSNTLYFRSRIFKNLQLFSIILLICIVLYKTILIPVQGYKYIEVVFIFPINFNVILGIFRLSFFLEENKFLRKLGKDSFAIYLLHQPFCCGFAGMFLYNYLRYPVLLVCLLCVGLSFALPYGFIWSIRKVKCFGRLSKRLMNIS